MTSFCLCRALLLLFSSRQFYLTHWGTWYNYARTLPGGGGGVLWYFHIYVGSGKKKLGAWNSWYFWGWKVDAGREPTHAEKKETPPPPREHSGFAEIRRLKKANLCEIKIKNMSPWRPWTPKITTHSGRKRRQPSYRVTTEFHIPNQPHASPQN